MARRSKAPHDPRCDLNPVALTFKRSFRAGEIFRVCDDCRAKVQRRHDEKERKTLKEALKPTCLTCGTKLETETSPCKCDGFAEGEEIAAAPGAEVEIGNPL